ncbi:hypothetical protein [Streptomyces sp. NPDC000878]
MACPAGVPVDIARTLQPKIEAEIAFVLAHDLTAPAIEPADAAPATAYVLAALEIVDSRIAAWNIDIVDTVADNASPACGSKTPLRRSGSAVSTSVGSRVWTSRSHHLRTVTTGAHRPFRPPVPRSTSATRPLAARAVRPGPGDVAGA